VRARLKTRVELSSLFLFGVLRTQPLTRPASNVLSLYSVALSIQSIILYYMILY